METVTQFNAELSSLYETKPPISKAKMTQITRSAMKAIKFYKHVVQSVEKFIQKCKAEYKVPGLYVIDSIVRQSRHQYTPEKDVFAPRFARNIQNTFLHLFNCTPEDKSKIVRVLNLWQKNNVFTAEVIQPLLDLASAVAAREPPNGVPTKTPPTTQQTAAARTPNKNSPAKDAWLAGGRNADNNIEPKIAPVSAPKVHKSKVKMDKKMFEYDYGEDEEGDADGGSPRGGSTAPATPASQQNVSIESLSSILSNPEVLRQLHTLQQQMAARKQQQEMEEKMRRLQEMKHQEEEFDRHLAQTVPNLPFAAECELKPSGSAAGLELPLMVPPPSQPPQSMFPQQMFSISDRGSDFDERSNRQMDDSNRAQESESAATEDDSRSLEVIDLVRSPGREPDRRRKRSRSRGRRSRSRSRSRRHRSRSNDRDDRKWDNNRRESDREKDRDRRKKGLPPVKKNHLTVCSTTLWVGHLSKLIQEDQLSNIFGEFGEIVSINLIPPRGCAFICMNRRQDAQKALHSLKYVKIQGKAITMAWAPGKGMKEKAWKDYWDVELGASYIPWNKLSTKTDIALLEDGGTLDPETFPDWLKEKYQSEGRSTDPNSGSLKVGGQSGKLEDNELPPLPSGPQPPAHPGGQPVHAAQPPGPETAPLPPPTLPPPAAPPAGPPLSLLPPPPPFPMQPRLLGPMGAMPMGPGLVGNMGNMPLGVPPPMMMAPHQVVTRIPGPPHFNPPGMGFMGSLDKRDGMLGVPPPLPPGMSPMTNPFGIPDHYQGNHSDKGNHDPMEMDVVNDMDEDSTDKDMHGNRGYDDRDMDMRPDNSQRDPDLPPEPFTAKWVPINKNRLSPSNEKSALGGMPHFDQFSSRPGRRDDDGPYPPPQLDFSRNQFFGNRRGGRPPRHLLHPPNGPMFNQPPRGHPPPGDLSRPPLPDWVTMGGRGGGGDHGGRGNHRNGVGRYNNFGGGPPPMMSGPPPPMIPAPTSASLPPGAPPSLIGALLPTPLDGPPPPLPASAAPPPRRRQDGERRSRWSAPSEPPVQFPPLTEAPPTIPPSPTLGHPPPTTFNPNQTPPVNFNAPPPFTPAPNESAAPASAGSDAEASTPAPTLPDTSSAPIPASLYSPSGEDSAPASIPATEESAPVSESLPADHPVDQPEKSTDNEMSVDPPSSNQCPEASDKQSDLDNNQSIVDNPEKSRIDNHEMSDMDNHFESVDAASISQVSHSDDHTESGEKSTDEPGFKAPVFEEEISSNLVSNEEPSTAATVHGDSSTEASFHTEPPAETSFHEAPTDSASCQEEVHQSAAHIEEDAPSAVPSIEELPNADLSLYEEPSKEFSFQDEPSVHSPQTHQTEPMGMPAESAQDSSPPVASRDEQQSEEPMHQESAAGSPKAVDSDDL